MAAIHIPEEILIKILLRLPVKSLLLFKSVCKSWYFIISSSDFVEQQLHYRKSLGETHLLLFNKKTNSLSIDHERKSMDPSIFHCPVLDFNSLRFRFHGSCNGLVCFSTCRGEKELFVWNPATKRCLKLPQPTAPSIDPNRILDSYVYVAFGYHPRMKEYKVIWFNVLITRNNAGFGSRMETHGQIYSFLTKSWRNLLALPDNIALGNYNRAQPILIDGVLYGRREYNNNNKVNKSLWSFDIGSEKFDDIKYQDEVYVDANNTKNYLCPCMFSTASMGQRLGLFQLCGTLLHVLVADFRKPEIWTERYVFERRPGILNKPVRFNQVHGFTMSKYGWFIFCDLENRKWGFFREHTDFDDLMVVGSTYLESLVSV